MTRLTALALLFTTLGVAQDVAGSWIAIPAHSGPLRRFERLTLKLTRSRNDTLAGTLMSYGRFGADALTCTSVSFHESILSFNFSGQGTPVMVFNGTMSTDGKSIGGTIQGPGLNEKIEFNRSGKVPQPKADGGAPK